LIDIVYATIYSIILVFLCDGVGETGFF